MQGDYDRLTGLGVEFTQPIPMGPVTTAVFDDTCSNLIQTAGSARTRGRDALPQGRVSVTAAPAQPALT